jgi:hypothetical protein
MQMPRKTKVRIVGDPDLAAHIAQTLNDNYIFEKPPERFAKAVGRDYAHSDSAGVTIYMTVKAKKADPNVINGIRIKNPNATAEDCCHDCPDSDTARCLPQFCKVGE